MKGKDCRITTTNCILGISYTRDRQAKRKIGKKEGKRVSIDFRRRN
jgi:hypothetical protein